MLYSHTSGVALRATLYLALQTPGKLFPVREIAQATGLSGPYLAKIMHRLIRAGLVRAYRGPGGGLELGRPPGEISLWSVVLAMDGTVESEWCVLGLQACSEQNPCPLHQQWYPLRAAMQSLLEETTLASLTQLSRVPSGLARQSRREESLAVDPAGPVEAIRRKRSEKCQARRGK